MGKKWDNVDNMELPSVKFICNHYNAWANLVKIKISTF